MPTELSDEGKLSGSRRPTTPYRFRARIRGSGEVSPLLPLRMARPFAPTAQTRRDERASTDVRTLLRRFLFGFVTSSCVTFQEWPSHESTMAPLREGAP